MLPEALDRLGDRLRRSAMESKCFSRWTADQEISKIEDDSGSARLRKVCVCCRCLLLFGFSFWNLFPHPTLILIAAVTGTDLLCLLYWIRKSWQIRWLRVDFWMLLFGFLLLSGSFGGYGDVSSGFLSCFLLFSAWFTVRVLPVRHSERPWLRASFLCGGGICAAYGVWQYGAGLGQMKWIDSKRFSDIGGRVCSFFSNPNLLAIFLLFLLPIAFAGMLSEKLPAKRFFNALLFGCICLCMIFTWSRGAWLGSLAAMVLICLLYSRHSFSLLLLAVPFVFLSIPWLPTSIRNRFASIGSLQGESSIRYRFESWEGIGRMIAAHPWGIGCGETAFHAVYPKFAVSGTETLMHAHQLFLQIAVELGVAGVLVFCGILIALLQVCIIGCRRLSESVPRAFFLGRAGALAALLVMGLFDSIWYHAGLFWLFWINAAEMVQQIAEEEK